MARVFGLALLVAVGAASVRAAPPSVTIGDLSVAVVSTARRIDLNGEGEPHPRVVVTCRLSAARSGVIDHLLDPARGLSLATAEGLEFPLVRVMRRALEADEAEYDFEFDGAPGPGTTVRLRGAVVHYQKRREFTVEVSDLAQPVGATGTVGEVTLRVTWLSPARVGEERRWFFSGRVERTAPDEAGAVEWSDDRVDLLDSAGTRWPASNLRITHGDESAKHVVFVDCFFPIPESAKPGALRYQCTRFDGVTVSPYEFTSLPLP